MEALELHSDVHYFLEKYYGKAELGAMLKSLTLPTRFTCIRVNTLKVTRDLLAQLLTDHFSKENTPYSLELHPEMDDIILIHSSGPHDVANIHPQVVVDTKCGQAVLMGSDIFVPGVIGAASYINPGATVSVVIDVDGVMLKGDYRKLQGRSFFVGNGIAQMGRDDIFRHQQQPRGVAVSLQQPGARVWDHPPLNGVFDQFMFLQHLPSVVVAHQLNPLPNSLVLDMCAAPGGKTLHIATRMKNEGRVFAFDKSKAKVKHIQEQAEKHGISIITALHKDSTKLLQIPAPSSSEDSAYDNHLQQFFKPGSFHFILLDPPCSGLGQRPRLKETITLVDVLSASKYQQRLLDVAVTLLKPGGTLVYSTCTINPEENEGNVSYVLSTHHTMQLVPQDHRYVYGDIGLDAFGLTLDQRKCLQRFSPSGPLNTIGFFIAKFTKIPEH
eukprot:Phypoly_transcript_05059.p1 GENE.Phypoly_transcript_05059~~Phypoly_transcript_05059.p1  ORF type:complete len:441 (+),score=51.63 Phypoly_transcript_05059:73-1395(+)